MRGTIGELLVVLGEFTAVRLELLVVGSELQRVLLVGLGRLPRVENDLVEDLETDHEKTEISVTLLPVLIEEESAVRYHAGEAEGLRDSAVIFFSLL